MSPRSVADLADLDRGRLLAARGAQRLARRLVLANLRGLAQGGLRLVDDRGEHFFGDPASEPQVALRVHHPRFYGRVVFGGSIGAGESYMAGEWSTDDLTALVRLMLRNREQLDGLDRGWAALSRPFHRLAHRLRANTLTGSRQNIAAHYDLGNEFFALFLDRNLMYSCARFGQGATTLEEASDAKVEGICQKLDLRPEDHLLEIGTGWGGFALHAASRYGCRVTTTTISPRQYRHARDRVRAAGLEDRVTVVAEDYRRLEGRYDKLVSIEMIEAVGLAELGTFFRTSAERLRPGGLMVLQSITIAEGLFERARRSVDFIQRYIFPGGAIPSVSALLKAVGSSSDLQMLHLEEIGAHYAPTLAAWRERFLGRLPEVRRLGFSQRFVRMWEYYLSYCEGGFLERATGDVQLVLAKPGREAPAAGG